jgi:hypothetical protein
MEATRLRFGSMLEWVVAAAFVAGVLALGITVFEELRTVRAVVPVLAGPAPVRDTSAVIPPGAVSVPLLLLGGEREVRLGDRVSDVVARLGAAARAGVESLEQTAARERITRVYEHAGTSFVLVFEALELQDEPRVSAIYVK